MWQVGWRRGRRSGGKYAVICRPNQETQAKASFSPQPRKQKPQTGAATTGPVAAGKGCPMDFRKPRSRANQHRPLSRVFYLPCCDLATYRFSYLLPPATNFFPVLLTTHCHATEYAHRTKRTEVPVISLTACLVLIRFSWPHPL